METNALLVLTNDVKLLVVGWRSREAHGVVEHEALLTQLQECATWGRMGEGADGAGGGGGVFESSPPVVAEPHEVLWEIERGAALLGQALGVSARRSTSDWLRGVVGAVASTDDADLATDACAQVHGWRVAAEVACGHRERARTLAEPCPICHAPNRLKVMLDEHGPSRADCVACGAGWDKAWLGVLAEMLVKAS